MLNKWAELLPIALETQLPNCTSLGNDWISGLLHVCAQVLWLETVPYCMNCSLLLGHKGKASPWILCWSIVVGCKPRRGSAKIFLLCKYRWGYWIRAWILGLLFLRTIINLLSGSGSVKVSVSHARAWELSRPINLAAQCVKAFARNASESHMFWEKALMLVLADEESYTAVWEKDVMNT